MDKGKKGLGFFGFAGIIVAVLILTGIIKIPGIIGTILGVGLLAAGLGIAAIVVLALVFAFKGSKDENANVKADVNALVRAREQEITKINSKIAIAKMDTKKLLNNIKDLEGKMERSDSADTKALYEGQRDKLLATVSEYERTISDANNRVSMLKNEILDLQNRRDDAISKMNYANEVKNSQTSSLEKFEEDAQFQEDYANALKELEGLEKGRR